MWLLGVYRFTGVGENQTGLTGNKRELVLQTLTHKIINTVPEA